MSHYASIFCKDCNIGTDVDFSYYDQKGSIASALTALAKNWSKIIYLDLCTNNRLIYSLDYNMSELIDFMYAHATHNLVIRSEFGHEHCPDIQLVWG